MTVGRRSSVSLLLGCTLALAPAVAFAHSGEGIAGGFVAGLLHPIFGWDHVAAMVAVGMWGAFLGMPAIWLLPVVFPMVMAFGGALGVIGVPIPSVEVGIAASAVVLGLMVALAARPPLWVAAVIVGAFAIFHGHAHGTELPDAAKLVARTAQPSDVAAIVDLVDRAYPGEASYSPGMVQGQVTQFPMGQFVVEYEGAVVGYAATFVIDERTAMRPHTWSAITGGGYVARHDPNGDWLYGMEVCVDPRFRGLRIGQRLYDARKRLCEELELKGIVFGGRMPGFAFHRAAYPTPEDYLEAVKAKKIRDPVADFQIGNDFEPQGVLRNYLLDDALLAARRSELPDLLWRRYEPPILLFAVMVQWAEVSTKVFHADVLDVPVRHSIFIFAPAAIGIVAGLRLVQVLERRARLGWLVGAGFILLIVSFVCMSLTVPFAESLEALNPAGIFSPGPLGETSARIIIAIIFSTAAAFSFAVVGVASRSVVNEQVPNEIQGRVFAAQAVLTNLASIPPILLAGLLSELVGVAPVMILTVAILVGAAGWSLANAYARQESANDAAVA